MYDGLLAFFDDPLQRVLLATLFLGLVLGALLQWSRFCLLRGWVQWHRGEGWAGLHLFALALAVALLGSQVLFVFQWVNPAQSIYLQAQAPWPLIFLGGLLFGYGMTLANACGARSLVLLGSGNLRSLVTLLMLALGAGMTLSGALAPVRLFLESSLHWSLPLTQLPAWLGGLLALGLLFWVGTARTLRSQPKKAWAAVGIGCCVPAAWWITGVLGADDFDPVRLGSLSFVAPLAETQQYLLLATGTRLSFGVVLVASLLLGAFFSARYTQSFSWQFFESPQQLAGSLCGGFMMGVGGVLALGCSLGQGLSGLSTLALTSVVAFAAMLLGSWLRLRQT